MYIAIKSEMDSRPLVYPLLRILKQHGSVLCISANKQMNRLIEEGEAGFRNIGVIVDQDGATDDIYEEYGISAGDYDFVILDNVGALEYDMLLIPLGTAHSPNFDDEVNLIREEANVRLIQFGKAAPKPREERAKSEPRSRPARSKSVEAPEDYNPADKFADKENDPRLRKERQMVTKSCNLPTMQQIEDFEATHKFYDVDRVLSEVLYDIFGTLIHVDKTNFMKEVRKRDESSGYIKSRNTAGA